MSAQRTAKHPSSLYGCAVYIIFPVTPYWVVFFVCVFWGGLCVIFPASFSGFSRVFSFSCVLASVWCLLPPVFALDVTVLTVVW